MNKTSNKLFFEELINKIHNNNISSAKELNLLKIKLAKKYKINKVVKNSQIIGFADKETREKLINLLNIKPIRDISGVNVVALFTKPHNCPHGRCVYCPGGLKSEFGDTPQSYTGFEPAALRAIRNNYDPYFQVFNRLEHYVINGKIPDKLELIFMGGTFPVLDKNYRDNFVYYVYKAINDFSEEFLYLDENNKKQVDFKKFNIFFETDKDLNSKEREKNILEKFEQLKYNNNNDSCDNYKDEIKKVQYALIRPIGLTIETRPDETLKKSCLEMLNYGCTRFEIGVQSLNDEVLKKNNRGHGLKEIKESFEILKDMCFKINVHMMIGLAFSDIAKDKKSLIDLFKDRSFRPDMIKIYPCLVVRGTKLYDMYKLGQYTPIKTQKASEIISKSFKYFPRYVRVMRVQRDIPTQNVVAGVLNSNLRDYVDAKLKNENIISIDIRSREIGHRLLKGYNIGDFKIKVTKYDSSGGIDFFIESVDNQDTLMGFVRLRFPGEYGYIDEISEGSALIRELHIYGSTVSVGNCGDVKDFQHKGWGKKLLQKAEDIAKEHGFEKMVVISGVGVREYYQKLGYHLEKYYMVKKI